MNRIALIIATGALLSAAACVKPKVYRAEFAARNQAEAREKVLLQELLERRLETTNLIKQVADLNLTIGGQNEELNDLRNELNARTRQMGESSSKLSTQLSQMENELAAKNSLLDQRTAVLQKVQSAQKERKRILGDLKTNLTKAFANTAGVVVELTQDEAVSVSLPDKTLFNSDAITVSATGKNLLKPLADLLGEHPEYDVEVIAYTDNSLPKDKSIKDTWDWSLLRATNIVRLLIRDFNTNANQLTPIGRGEFYPVSSNATPDGRLANRRTIVMIHPSLPAVPAAE
ncbi:MAG TPA: OmpA family protein [Saprospiraceae bacterium]|nr:OmpA family protein [Saprospiraceae bacterium]HNL39197.1 OmpA family protein [Saprospiraceae bacterium]HNM25891.1 OmpA family protein [Saprospiraceae bacterium]